MQFGRPLHLALLAVLLAAVAWWSLAGYSPAVSPGPLPAVSLQFDGSRAWQSAKALAEQHPGRVISTPAGQRSAAYLADQFKTLGLQSETIGFREHSAPVGREFAGINSCGVSAGTGEGAVLFTAHRDVHINTREGAVDNGSGVGAILELARVLAPGPHRYTYVFCALDGEEVGLLGARALLKAPPAYLQDIRLVINLDMVGFRQNDSLLIRDTDYLHPQVLGLLQEVVRPTGSPLPRVGLTQPSIPINTDADQFRWGNWPIVDILDPNPRAYPYYHKPEDTIEKLLPDSLQRIGRTVEELVRMGDALGAFSQSSGLVLARYQGGRYEILLPWRLTVAGACVLLILSLPAVHAFLLLRQQRLRVRAVLAAQRSPLITLAALVLLAGLLKTPLPAILLGFSLIIALRRSAEPESGLGRLLAALVPPLLFVGGWWAAGQWLMFAPYALVAVLPALLLTWRPGWLWRTLDLIPVVVLGAVASFPEVVKLSQVYFLSAKADWLPPFLRLWAVRLYLFSPVERALLAVCFSLAVLAAVWGACSKRRQTASLAPQYHSANSSSGPA